MSCFSPSIPHLQLVWDSTSLGWIKLCPRYYQLSMIECWRPKGESVHLTFGRHFHSALEAYDKAKIIEGLGHDDAVRIAARTTINLARGWISTDDYKNPTTLFRSVIWYLETWKNDPLQTITLPNGGAAVELSGQFDIPGTHFTIAWHMDKLASMGDNIYVVDRKTTKSTISTRFFEGFNPDNQMTLYTAAAKIAYSIPASGVVIDAAQVTKEWTRFARGFTYRDKGSLEEWLVDTRYWLNVAENCATTEYWPMNDKACNLYGGCPYRKVCSVAPSIRKTVLEADYEHSVWDPTEKR